MNLLLKSATIIDATSKHHLKKRDILIEDGMIIKIAETIKNETSTREINLENLHVSQGWFDSSVCFGEPGYEERETLENGLKTAAKSGFTGVAINANTNPILANKTDIEFIKQKAQAHAVNLYPIGALTKNTEDFAELFDMKNTGAVAFYDYQSPIENPNILKLALQYTQGFGALVLSFPQDTAISRNGMVNEGENSTKLGLKGIPALAEELQVARDLFILEYAGGKLHIPTISTAKSVALIKEAKKKGLNVSCSVAIHNLLLTDKVLYDYNTNHKVLPPLRTEKDIKALITGLKNGIIDGVTSDHNPIDIENKKTEFDYAFFGTIGLESAFGALNTCLDLETVINTLSNGLKERFNIPTHAINEGELANITLFNPETPYSFSEKDIVSSSKNSALLGCQIKGRAYGIYANKQLMIN